jgi:hypothetical protein
MGEARGAGCGQAAAERLLHDEDSGAENKDQCIVFLSNMLTMVN